MYFFQKAGSVEVKDLVDKFKAYDELMKEQGINQDVKYVESFTMADTTYNLFTGNPISLEDDPMLFFCYNNKSTFLFDSDDKGDGEDEELVYIYHDYIKNEADINIMRGFYENTIALFESLI